jgi:glucuronosyltransferase
MKFTCLLFIFALSVSGSIGLKILGVFPFTGSSHFAIGNGIIKSLHEAGHDVTVISPFPKKTPIPKHRDISLTDLLSQFKKGKKLISRF